MRPAGYRAVAIGAAWLVLAPVLAGHEGVSVLIEIAPGTPVVGEACRVTVTVTAAPGLLSSQRQRVWVTAEMTGHAMRPVEAELGPGDRPRDYAGALVFTMAGPWRVTVHVEDRDEVMWTVLDLDVEQPGASVSPKPARFLGELQDPVRSNLFPPAWVLAGAVGLTLMAEGTAAAVKLLRAARARRRRRTDLDEWLDRLHA